jgi:hypothetical protein
LSGWGFVGGALEEAEEVPQVSRKLWASD